MMAAIPTARGPAAYALAAGSVISLLPVLKERVLPLTRK
jgi:hypothetical protein